MLTQQSVKMHVKLLTLDKNQKKPNIKHKTQSKQFLFY